MSACASFSSSSRADANRSNSLSDSEPSSLHGSRCSASSMTPPCTCHDTACPLNCLTPNAFPFASSELDRLLHPVHLLDLALHTRRNRIALQLAHCRKHSTVDRERLRPQAKRSHLLVVRQLRIPCIQRRLHLSAADVPSDDRRKISAPIAHDNHLLRLRQMAGEFL